MLPKSLNKTLDKLCIEDISGNKLINSLPGIFYLYEQINDKFHLVFWNRNHEIVTGYSSDELLNKDALDFFNKEEHNSIIRAISKIFTYGEVKQVFGNLKLKNGKTIPYIFEGYKLDRANRPFFIGTGINISTYIDDKIKLNKVESKLSKKNRELFSVLIDKEKNKAFINETYQELDKILVKKDVNEIKKDIKNLKSKLIKSQNSNDNWEMFKFQFNAINPSFFNSLQIKHPNLTKKELRYCAYLRINLSNDQISFIQNISKEGIKKKRYRLRKKLKLSKDISLENFIDRI